MKLIKAAAILFCLLVTSDLSTAQVPQDYQAARNGLSGLGALLGGGNNNANTGGGLGALLGGGNNSGGGLGGLLGGGNNSAGALGGLLGGGNNTAGALGGLLGGGNTGGGGLGGLIGGGNTGGGGLGALIGGGNTGGGALGGLLGGGNANSGGLGALQGVLPGIGGATQNNNVGTDILSRVNQKSKSLIDRTTGWARQKKQKMGQKMLGNALGNFIPSLKPQQSTQAKSAFDWLKPNNLQAPTQPPVQAAQNYGQQPAIRY